MIRFSNPLKITVLESGKQVQLKGSSNPFLMALPFVALIIIGLGLIFFQKFILEWTPEFLIGMVYFMLFFLIWKCVLLIRDYKKLLMPVTNLSFNHEGIRLIRSGFKKKIDQFPVEKIKRIKVFVDNVYNSNTDIDFHLNNESFPFIQLQLEPLPDKELPEIIEHLMHAIQLVKFQEYKLSNGVTLSEFVTDIEFRKPEKFSRNNFHLYETGEELNYQARIDTGNYLKLDLKNNLLTAKTNVFYTIELPFEHIIQFKSKIRHQTIQKHIDEFIITELVATDNKNEEHIVLSNKLSLVESNYNILHYEAQKELDEIINRISEITNVAGNIKPLKY